MPKPQEKKNNELDILLPESEVVIKGEKIEIKPFPFAKLPKVITAISGMGAAIYKLFASNGLTFTEEGSVIINQAFLENIGAVTEEHFSDVVELIAVYTNKAASFYLDKEEGLNAEDGLMLLCGIIERNYDFFMKRLSPAIAKIKAKGK